MVMVVVMANKRRRRPQPLAPPPHSSALRSRKRARRATTKFHKYSRELDDAIARARAGGCSVSPDDGLDRPTDAGDGEGGDGRDNCGGAPSESQIALLDEVRKWKDKISEMGGREEYQRASQMNTSLFSTSRWVLGVLGRWGWLDGLTASMLNGVSSSHGGDAEGDADADHVSGQRRIGRKGKKEKTPRRDVRLLEVGAINTQLLDAAARTRKSKNRAADDAAAPAVDNPDSREGNGSSSAREAERVHRLDVRAIDIRSTDPRIEQVDFFDLPPPPDGGRGEIRYDVIVNSMVVNCVTTPAQRGRMLSLCYGILRAGGVCFLTLPKLCLTQSKFMSRSHFEDLLMRGIGFEILREAGRDSPKVAFYVLRRPWAVSNGGDEARDWDNKFASTPELHRGKKFRNTFAVTLAKDDFLWSMP